MKIGIVSDIHCNHEALRIALDRMGEVDELLCAGDAVYQFRFSNEVIEVLRERGARYILGNHEDVLLGKWGEHARSADWVRESELQYMAGQAYSLETRINGKTLVMVHGSPWEPHNEYIYPNSPAISRFAELRRGLRDPRAHALPDGGARRAGAGDQSGVGGGAARSAQRRSSCRTRCWTRRRTR